ncbi:SRPBCC family protein [Sphingomonas aracearum]|uniref:SRPBCC family protein n=1 Tax=Sphingomonas aracearum TaxID=2283317 RepID=A0A369VS16_9SPHN|nr:SRPBCC family protein [Sphingomonas aracearum]RDE05174.1 SRPBCC family protein [Sphingomonas aracearum]
MTAVNDESPRHPIRPALTRIGAAIGAALMFALGFYMLMEAARPNDGLVSFSFLLALPAALCAFIAYVADPWKERSHRFYLAVPLWLLGAVVVASVFLLHEGVICVVLLAPLWLASGLIGTELTWRLRRRTGEGRTYCVALIAVPLVAMQVEPGVPLPVAEPVVARSIVVNAPPAALWPMLRGIPDVRPGEGRWNLTQNVIGVPRPVAARLVGRGIGATRFADWGEHIRFREQITAWVPGREIGWRFVFDDMAGWGYTDRHLMPDSPYFRVTTGGYRLEPLGPNRTRVLLHTRYRITTPVNLYATLWGELFLGDLENNLLAIIKARAERPAGTHVGDAA